jgi:ribosomal protein L16 Arg81 hydroxylase
MEKGDLLYIPSGIVHSAIPIGPRVVISIGVF